VTYALSRIPEAIASLFYFPRKARDRRIMAVPPLMKQVCASYTMRIRINSYASGMTNYIKLSLVSPPSHIQDGFQVIVRSHPRRRRRQRADSPAFEVRRCQHRRVWYVMCYTRSNAV
jgi:hypothetical protein